jgi:hypothetical protein
VREPLCAGDQVAEQMDTGRAEVQRVPGRIRSLCRGLHRGRIDTCA